MSRRKPSKACNSRRTQHRHIARGCKLKNRAKDMDEIRKTIENEETAPLDNPNHVRCIECDRTMEAATIENHRKSREHKRRLKALEEDAQLEEDRKNGLF